MLKWLIMLKLVVGIREIKVYLLLVRRVFLNVRNILENIWRVFCEVKYVFILGLIGLFLCIYIRK